MAHFKSTILALRADSIAPTAFVDPKKAANRRYIFTIPCHAIRARVLSLVEISFD